MFLDIYYCDTIKFKEKKIYKDIFNLRIIIYNLKFQVRQCIKLMFKVISSNFIYLSTVETSLVKQVVESCLWNLMVMFMDDVRYFQSFTIFTTNSYRHRTLHLECTETTFLPGVRIGEDKRGAHRLTQLYFAKNS